MKQIIEEKTLPCGLKGFDKILNKSLCYGCYKDCGNCSNYLWFSCANNCTQNCTIEKIEQCYSSFKVGD